MKYWSVPPMWRGETVVIAAGGPSLTQDQVTYCRGKCPVIVINDNYLLAPWADIHYWADRKWYDWHRAGEHPSQALFGKDRALALFWGFQGLRVMIHNHWQHVHGFEPSVLLLRNDSTQDDGSTIRHGLCETPDGIRSGANSGYQAINLAYHTRARRIVLIGYDMRASNGRSHWFGEHPISQGGKVMPRPAPNLTHCQEFVPNFTILAKALKEKSVEVVNCTPGSALQCFPSANLEDVL